MDRMFEIVLLALIFGGFDHRFVAEGIHCPEFRMSEDLTVFSFDDRPTTGICVSEVSTRHVLKQTFHVIDNFERACNYYYHGHLRWNRNRFVDGYKHRRRHSVPWFNQGYAIRKWDLDGPEEVATGLSEGILRVDRLYRRKNLLENESSLVYEDIITSVPRGGDFKVQLCSLIVNDTVEGNFEFYGNGSDNILWEPCTQRRSDYFYCLLQPIDSRHHKSTKPLICNEGYTGFYCILEAVKFKVAVTAENAFWELKEIGATALLIMNPCTDVNCNNRGNCTVKNGHPVCVCNDENYTGAFCERRRPGLVGPLINGPLQDVFATMLTHQGTPCENFEMNYMRCMEAYGQILGKRYCDLELRDFYECVYKTKRVNVCIEIDFASFVHCMHLVIIMNTEKASNKEGAFNKDLKKSNQPNKEDDPYSWFEDDEFEEFSDGDCSDGELPENSEENTEDLWEDNWDDDNVEEDFSREKSADQVEADEAQNCGVGKEAGQKVRKAWAGQKQFGIEAEFSYLFLPTLSTSVPDSKNCNCKTDVKPVSSKRKVELDSLAVQKPEKKAKLPNAGTDSDGSNDWFRIMEEEVRHCFQRHPMSTTDLVAKFKSRCKKMNKQEIVSQLANILKKLKPEQTRRKGTALHFTLLYVARIFHKFAAVSMNR
ncbi:General transcription factor IIF subunit 1 [Trichinella nelsoni]|uniref:Transcription initiation factor IIF subunit alpha n=1 Tax=Trichinella nelsoni TaxID=6336 RepID=A0A0V0S3K0_9BILA|nr:General transcription factor IIF subunit 1 [Trichinella nelsoni]